MIRHAVMNDIAGVVNIYNQAIEARFQTAFMQPHTVQERLTWFQQHIDSSYPMFVYESDEEVIGWFSISPYRSGRAALRYSVEISYFVHNEHFHKGIGSQLLQFGINACRMLGYKTAIAIILDRNSSSIRLMNKFGFEQWAFLPGVADFDGVECNQVYYGIKL